MTGKYEEIGATIGALVDRKNAAYGNSIHDTAQIVRIFYPKGMDPEQYDDVMFIIKIIDEMFCITTQKDCGKSPYENIAIYAILKCREESCAGK